MDDSWVGWIETTGSLCDMNPIGYNFNSPVVTKAVKRLKGLIMQVHLELSVGVGKGLLTHFKSPNQQWKGLL